MPQLLASLEDFAAARGGTFDPTDLQAIIALEGASGVVRAYCARDFVYVEDDEITVFATGGAGLLLPEFPVYDVSAVTLISADATETDLMTDEWFLDGASGILYRISSTGSYPWTWGWPWGLAAPNRIRVTYSHGYVLPGEPEIDGVEDLPSELALVTISIASRNVQTSASGGQTVRSKQVGSFQVSYGDQSTTVDETGITATERQVLERYRKRSTP